MDRTTRTANEIFTKKGGPEKDNVVLEIVKPADLKKGKVPYMDSSPINLYLERRLAGLNLHLSERTLNRKRKELVVGEQNLRLQWNALAVKENALKEHFILFSKFLRTNLEKKERAAKKSLTNTEMVQKRLEDIKILRKKYGILSYQFQLMQSEIVKHSRYKSYLERVVDLSSGEFKDMDDIPKRMEVLLLTQKKVLDRHGNQLSILECSKRMMALFLESKMLQIVGFNNIIASLQYAYDQAVSRTLELDQIVNDVKWTLVNSAIDLKSNMDGIQDLYHHSCKMHRLKESYRLNILDQLMQLNNSMKIYEKISQLIKRKRGSKFHTK